MDHMGSPGKNDDDDDDGFIDLGSLPAPGGRTTAGAALPSSEETPQPLPRDEDETLTPEAYQQRAAASSRGVGVLPLGDGFAKNFLGEGMSLLRALGRGGGGATTCDDTEGEGGEEAMAAVVVVGQREFKGEEVGIITSASSLTLEAAALPPPPRLTAEELRGAPARMRPPGALDEGARREMEALAEVGEGCRDRFDKRSGFGLYEEDSDDEDEDDDEG